MLVQTYRGATGAPTAENDQMTYKWTMEECGSVRLIGVSVCSAGTQAMMLETNQATVGSCAVRKTSVKHWGSIPRPADVLMPDNKGSKSQSWFGACSCYLTDYFIKRAQDNWSLLLYILLFADNGTINDEM